MLRPTLILTTLALLATPAAAQVMQRSGGSRQVNTLQLLNQRLPEVRFVEQPFEQVIDWLADFTQMNVVVRWDTLEDSGVERDVPISIQVKNLRLSQVLWLIMNEAGGADLRLAYRATGNLLVLSTEEDLGREMVTKVYDVADLLLRPPSAPRPDFQQNDQGLGQQTQGGGGGQSVFGNNQDNNRDDEDELDSDVQMEELINLITSTIEPDSWIVNGGGNGRIVSFNNVIIVTNTILVHQKIGGYITDDAILQN
jgi:hypothetical protein